ncbi:methionyl-tRNA formyltransferase [candidate division TA06 bacterium]|nr:methionyl-tRNA formyltransferase [candidate division TA06 bacterium]
MQIVFMGTPAFAVPTLEALHHKGHEILAVFAQPDRPAGRGRSIAFSPVKQKALELNLPVCQPAALKDNSTIDHLSNLQPDVLVVVAYGLLLPRNILSIPKHGAVNLHPSLLPKYRGAAPINHALLHGDKVTGITSILMNSRMDAGDIILQETVAISNDENAGQLEERLSGLGADLITRSLEVMKEGRSEFKKQDESLVTFAPKLSPKDGHIDWKRKSLEIQNQVRGLTPRPGAFTMFKEKRLEILEILQNTEYRILNTEEVPGLVVSIDKSKGPVIKTGDGSLVLLKVKPQGKKEMSGQEFLRGYRLDAGEQLT